MGCQTRYRAFLRGGLRQVSCFDVEGLWTPACAALVTPRQSGAASPVRPVPSGPGSEDSFRGLGRVVPCAVLARVPLPGQAPRGADSTCEPGELRERKGALRRCKRPALAEPLSRTPNDS